ncbi:unnamed protein product, partial [Polarella glacialis]
AVATLRAPSGREITGRRGQGLPSQEEEDKELLVHFQPSMLSARKATDSETDMMLRTRS